MNNGCKLQQTFLKHRLAESQTISHSKCIDNDAGLGPSVNKCTCICKFKKKGFEFLIDVKKLKILFKV